MEDLYVNKFYLLHISNRFYVKNLPIGRLNSCRFQLNDYFNAS